MPIVTIPPSPFPPSSDESGDIVERVTELETNVSTLQTTKANQNTIAPTFNAETSYTVGDIIYYNGVSYKCTTNHTGAWNAEHFTATTIANELDTVESDVSNLQTTKANQITIAPTFNSETSYDIGDLVYYNGLTYKCTTAHEGAWDATDFTATTIANELQNSGSGVDYSTTEQATGQKWIDGNDIYFRTFEFDPAKTVANNAWSNLNIESTGIEQPIKCFALTTGVCWSDVDVSITVNVGYISAMCQRNNDTISISSLVLYYTKATV